MKLKILEFATKLEQIKYNLELNEYILDSVKPKERFPRGYDFSETPMIKNKKSEIEFLNNIILEFENTFKEYKITEDYLREQKFKEELFSKPKLNI